MKALKALYSVPEIRGALMLFAFLVPVITLPCVYFHFAADSRVEERAKADAAAWLRKNHHEEVAVGVPSIDWAEGHPAYARVETETNVYHLACKPTRVSSARGCVLLFVEASWHRR